MNDYLGYTIYVRVKKFVAITLAFGYFFVANCRFACAMRMSEQSPIAAESRHEQNDGACHHEEESKDQSDGQKNHPAPCCMTHLDDAAALFPAVVALYDASSLLFVYPMVVSKVALPLPRLLAFGDTRAPPLIASQVLTQSSHGPRAPPFPTVVL